MLCTQIPHAGLVRRHVRSTTDTSATGTLNAMPVSLLESGQNREILDLWRHPFLFKRRGTICRCGGRTYPLSSGMTLPTALAAPVEAGMMFWWAPRPSRQALAWTVVYRGKECRGVVFVLVHSHDKHWGVG
uniref:Uncharacterized protein n=1 Tax=Cyclopterus lumpus TaxID=8103 RepID=A0A8C2WPV9_CYCLU